MIPHSRLDEWRTPLGGDRRMLTEPVSLVPMLSHSAKLNDFNQLYLSSVFAAKGLNRKSRILFYCGHDRGTVYKFNNGSIDMTHGGKVQVDFLINDSTIPEPVDTWGTWVPTDLMQHYDMICLSTGCISYELMTTANRCGTVLTNHITLCRHKRSRAYVTSGFMRYGNDAMPYVFIDRYGTAIRTTVFGIGREYPMNTSFSEIALFEGDPDYGIPLG